MEGSLYYRRTGQAQADAKFRRAAVVVLLFGASLTLNVVMSFKLITARHEIQRCR